MSGKKKTVLFISPAFFGYEEDIKNAIIDNGYSVDFFDERTSNNSVYKAIFRVRKNLLSNSIKKHYSNILKKTKDRHYNFFLLIKGEVIPEWFIIEFKKNNPETKLIYYTYDSISNNNANSLYILKHFDSCYSFDFEDTNANPFLKLKHLFYSKEYSLPLKTGFNRIYSLSFVGTLHSSRYKIVKDFFSSFDKTFVFFFAPAKWFFFIEKTLKKDYRNIKWKEISFNKLTKQEVAGIFKSSNCVLDIQRSGQTGLTMRTFEVLASGAILITTNPYIKKTNFYNERIIVLENLNVNDNISDIKLSIEKANQLSSVNINLKKYAIDNWVKEFFM